MFTKPIDEITFEDVESFCREWPEGVRVEYKREIRHIRKIVSSFANTYGGIFLIGVEADQANNEVSFPIKGIPQRNGIEEQIQQSALTGIYPGVIPEIKVVDVPDSENVVVVVRVDESVQAPHAVKDVTQVYIRVGSITQPYEYKLADMDRLAYMFKRREDSQVVARQIFDRIKGRTGRYFSIETPDLTIIAKPVFPYRPVISVSDIYGLHQVLPIPIRRVEGGVSCINDGKCLELNKYGIVYDRTALSVSDQQAIEYDRFFLHINRTIKHAISLYNRCEYLGNIDVTAQLQGVLEIKLTDPDNRVYRNGGMLTFYDDDTESIDTEVSASIQCLARDLENEERRKDIVEDLMCQLLWAFNIPTDEQWVRDLIRRWIR